MPQKAHLNGSKGDPHCSTTSVFCLWNVAGVGRFIGIVQKVFSARALAMRQKCVRNTSKWVLFYWGKRNVPKLRQKCAKNARNNFGVEHLLDDTEFRRVGFRTCWFGYFWILGWVLGPLSQTKLNAGKLWADLSFPDRLLEENHPSEVMQGPMLVKPRIVQRRPRRAPAEWNLRETFRFSHRFWREVLVKFSLAHPNPGKRSTENVTKISRQISWHLWQRKTEKTFTSALLQGRLL